MQNNIHHLTKEVIVPLLVQLFLQEPLLDQSVEMLKQYRVYSDLSSSSMSVDRRFEAGHLDAVSVSD